MPYDLLSLDTGAAPALDVPGVAEHAIPVKPVSSFHARWEALRAGRWRARTVHHRHRRRRCRGVELLLAVRTRLLRDQPMANVRLRFHVVTAGDDILPGHPRRARALYRRALDAAEVRVTTAFVVERVDAHGVHATDGRNLALDAVLWTTQAAAPSWPRTAGLATDTDGFVRVAPTLRSHAYPEVFAAGDLAAVDGHPRPKAGVFAVRQGPVLAANLRRACRGAALRPYRPQRVFLSLISTGGRHAVATRGRWATSGTWVWYWKDFIDRRFMQRYVPAARMTPPPAADGPGPDPLMPCAAAAAAQARQRGPARSAGVLAPAHRADVVIGLAGSDDAAVVRPPPGRLAVHSVDGFRSFIDDPWMLGRIAANHALNDLYAMGATPHNALAFVTLPHAAQARMQDDLVQILRGACAVLEPAGAALIGGHTAEGAELGVGFAVNGYVDEAALVRKTGVAPGDVLLLTQGLGTGVLFAAAMRGQARAAWIDTALATMVHSKAAAARCLVAHGVRAMTDVTGFGLVGHLLEMLDGHGARLRLGKVPLLDGAGALAAAGLRSTLHPDNLRAGGPLVADPALQGTARYALLFDPQTAGGLLAAVPAAAAEACERALHALGYGDSARIGTVTAAGGLAIEA